jgi:hypothetical protein
MQLERWHQHFAGDSLIQAQRFATIYRRCTSSAKNETTFGNKFDRLPNVRNSARPNSEFLCHAETAASALEAPVFCRFFVELLRKVRCVFVPALIRSTRDAVARAAGAVQTGQFSSMPCTVNVDAHMSRLRHYAAVQ